MHWIIMSNWKCNKVHVHAKEEKKKISDKKNTADELAFSHHWVLRFMQKHLYEELNVDHMLHFLL